MGQDRRQFYRIDHRVALDYRVVPEADVMSSARPYHFDVSPHFLLLGELQSMESDTGHLLRKIAEKQPDVAAYLKLLNRKIDAVAQSLVSEELSNSSGLRLKSINLSEGGLSFDSNQSLNQGDYLALKLVFPENRLGMLLYARVQRCYQIEGGFHIAIEFFKLTESCRTLIARYILEAQARERQRKLDAGH
ncbi:PilZ domain-containing protein [Marinobacterium aestuariivivens]|uniref:PilZ domain-containing protein n=1 Tax=Marinobacterium aestuariivivens TaxID=1698799 RepID=A0ABW2A512_9GAMM